MQYKKLFLLLIFIFTCKVAIHAQRAEIGINAGGAGYIGDLNQLNLLKISGPNGGVYTRINFDPHWSLGLHYNYGVIKADDSKSSNPQHVIRNLNFNTSLHEIAFITNFNFIDMYSPGSRKRLSPFLFAGIGGVIFNPKLMYNGTTEDLRRHNTEVNSKLYRNYAVVIPYGAGLKYKKTENWTLFTQIGYRTAFTDYLDDVSGVYPIQDVYWGGVNLSDPSQNNGGKMFQPGDQRGDFRKRDTYLFVNIGISYTFVSPKCFTF